MPCKRSPPLSNSPYRLGTLSVVAVLALRVVIGWHFFKEGTGKLQDPKPFSANFFGAAKGPFASTYARLVWDADGTARFDPQATHIAWESFRDRAKNHYQFDADQIDQSQKIIDRRIEQLGTYLDANGAAISEYLWWVERRDQNQADPKRLASTARSRPSKVRPTSWNPK